MTRSSRRTSAGRVGRAARRARIETRLLSAEAGGLDTGVLCGDPRVIMSAALG
jgi:hypothetical protein